MIFILLIFSSRNRICGLFRPTRSEQDDSNRPHFPARCLSSHRTHNRSNPQVHWQPQTSGLSDAPPKYDDLTIWHTINKKRDMLTIDDMQIYCKDVYLISLCNRWPMTFDDRSLQRHWNTRCCLSLIDYFLALIYKSNSLICRQGVSSVFYW